MSVLRGEHCGPVSSLKRRTDILLPTCRPRFGEYMQLPASASSRNAIWLACPFLASLLGAVIVVTLVKWDSAALRAAATAVEREHARLEALSGDTDQFDRLRDGYLMRKAMVDALAVDAALPILLLNTIGAFPDGIHLNSLSLQGRELNLDGVASDDAHVVTVLSQLRDAGFLPERVDPAKARKDSRQAFEIRAMFARDSFESSATAEMP